ncbi:hypothetical protein [Micromonospora aurantiaca (nom. illeg.)]|uniref:hypothetical protein n=1 Tax=Micromonospora aurantiaca (nom. illeg.) TaxID=47850 RepID=UPI000A4F415F
MDRVDQGQRRTLVARPSFFQLQAVRKAQAAGTPMHLIAHEDVLVFTKSHTGFGTEMAKDTGGGGMVA